MIAGVAIFIPAQSQAATHFVAGGGFHGAGHAFGGYRGGFHGGYRGGFYGYRGGYGYGYGFHRGFYGPGYGWWGWPTGLFLATLPLYYSTWWWNGVPYYYADNAYYTWNGGVGQYESVAPPAGLVNRDAPPGSQSAQGGPADGAPSGGTDLFAYPRNGQSQEQQATDRQECRDWAATQAGNAQRQGQGGQTQGGQTQGGSRTSELKLRAQAACLEGRGYSVK